MTTDRNSTRVTFDVTGTTRSDMEAAALNHLTRLDPDALWDIDLDVEPAVVSGDGRIHSWTGHVTAHLSIHLSALG